MPQANAWVFGAQSHKGWALGTEQSSAQGAQAASTLTLARDQCTLSKLSPQRLRPEQRLKDSAAIKQVFEGATGVARGRLFTVLARSNAVDYPRLAILVAKKKVKRATARNAIRRLARESFRAHQQALGGIDCVVLFKLQDRRLTAACLDKADIRAQLDRQWRQLTAGTLQSKKGSMR